MFTEALLNSHWNSVNELKLTNETEPAPDVWSSIYGPVARHKLALHSSKAL
jgi:hypothetical protein